jgi:hypothetical protein
VTTIESDPETEASDSDPFAASLSTLRPFPHFPKGIFHGDTDEDEQPDHDEAQSDKSKDESALLQDDEEFETHDTGELIAILISRS